MDEKAHEIQCSHEEVSGEVDQRASGNSRYLLDESVVDTKEAPCQSAENKDVDPSNSELGSKETIVEVISRVGGESEEASYPVEPKTTKSSSNLAVGVASETVMAISPVGTPIVNGGHRVFDAKVVKLGPSKLSVDESLTKVSEVENQSFVIDVNCGSGKASGDKREGERVCRICHLSSDQSPDRRKSINVSNVSTDLIHLGCGCKEDLGTVHAHCAEAWFKLKGNRSCEICGEIAANVTGIADGRFMEEWNERGFPVGSSSTDRNGRCWRGQPFCNFLMACLVIAFVLPWFFRVNMF